MDEDQPDNQAGSLYGSMKFGFEKAEIL